MSDSDISDDVFIFQNKGPIVSAKEPNININNHTGLSFRNNYVTSSNEWQRHSNYNQSSAMCKRKTSLISTTSACDASQINYKNLFYSREMSSQRLNSEQAKFPTMSSRRIDSNVSASDIIEAIKKFRGSQNELKMIQKAINRKLRKHETHSRIAMEKRRNLRVFLKGSKHNISVIDSGELGSNSSISSDNDKSIRALSYKNSSSYTSTIMDLADIRRNIKDGQKTTMVKDCTSKNMIDKPTIPKLLRPPVTSVNITHNQSSMNQSKFYRDRFKNKFILPSHRFNQSFVRTSIPKTLVEHPMNNSQELIVMMSDDEEILSEPTREKPTSNPRKRSMDKNIRCLPNSKKPKVDISQKDQFVKPASPTGLVSQEMDGTEKVNYIANNSQKSVNGKIQKKKNKAKKLVRTKNCLSRDLIHEILPAESMNPTAQSNKTITQNESEDKVNEDVTSIISASHNNEENLCNTFTDQNNGEVFSPKTLKNVQKSPQKPVLEKSPVKKLQKSPYKVSELSKKVLEEKNAATNCQEQNMEKYIKSFCKIVVESIVLDDEVEDMYEDISKALHNTTKAHFNIENPDWQCIPNMPAWLWSEESQGANAGQLP